MHACALQRLRCGIEWLHGCDGADEASSSQDDATLKCWGYNGEGQLGLGDASNRGDEANGPCPSSSPIESLMPGRRWSSNPTGKFPYERPTRGSVCGTMRIMCGADTGCSATDYSFSLCLPRVSLAEP